METKRRLTLPGLMHLATGLLALTHGAADASAETRHFRYGLGRRGRVRQVRPVAPDRCESAATHPKAALMFLTRGALHHEATWQAWFNTARDLQPKMPAEYDGCASAPVTCPPDMAPDAIDAQDLFNVYVHAAPDYVFDDTSMFAGRRVEARVQAGWGQHALIDAERALVQAALTDPRNARFVLLSESGVPLYPADTMYQQLIHEDKSRINACFFDGSDPWRWHPAMGRDTPALPRESWRKSPQWFTLTRKHAEAFANDTAVDGVFRRHCEHREFDAELQQGYHCYSDEHYLPVLLSHLQMGHETDCRGKSVNADWSRGGASPHTYRPEEVGADLLQRLRGGESCRSQTAVDLAPQMFTLAAQQACEPAPIWNADWLHAGCPLFARKFAEDAAGEIMQTVTACDNGLSLTRC